MHATLEILYTHFCHGGGRIQYAHTAKIKINKGELNGIFRALLSEEVL